MNCLGFRKIFIRFCFVLNLTLQPYDVITFKYLFILVVFVSNAV